MSKLILIVQAIILSTATVHANQPICEVWNYDTEQCETFAMQDLDIDKALAKLAEQDKIWTEEQVREYLQQTKDNK